MASDPRTEMTLAQLHAGGVVGVITGPEDQIVTGVQHDSRRVVPGDMFFAIPGARHDGGGFVPPEN